MNIFRFFLFCTRSMEECIASLGTGLILTEEEKEGLNVDEGAVERTVKTGELSLICKLYAPRSVGIEEGCSLSNLASEG